MTVGEHTWRSSIANMGGTFMLGVSVENRKPPGSRPARCSDVELALDTASAPSTGRRPRGRAGGRPGRRQVWEAWSFTRRKEAARQLTEAKKPETRARRLEKVLAELRALPARAPTISAWRRRPRLAHWVIRVAGLVYAVGVVLLAVAVYVDLPGSLGAYGDPEAWWPIAVKLGAGLLAFGTWRWVNRRNNRPFAVVLLGLGIATVLVLASASYGRCPDAGLSSRLERGHPGGRAGHQQLRDRHVRGAGAATDGVPLALQFARLAQLIVLLVAATSAVTALLRSQVDRVAVRWSPRLSRGARRRRDVGAAAAGAGGDSERLHAGRR